LLADGQQDSGAMVSMATQSFGEEIIAADPSFVPEGEVRSPRSAGLPNITLLFCNFLSYHLVVCFSGRMPHGNLRAYQPYIMGYPFLGCGLIHVFFLSSDLHYPYMQSN
jgi:hypothetical protein